MLRTLADRRLVVHGTDAGLAAVALRLLRTDRLADVAVGFVPTGRSAVAAVWGLPTDRDRAIAVALTGSVRPVPLVRDDAGGVLVGRGELTDVRGEGYCDDTLVFRGRARRVAVTPDGSGADGVVVTCSTGRLRRRGTVRGRAVQVGGEPTVPVRDGTPYPRPLARWTWYRHTSDLRAIR